MADYPAAVTSLQGDIKKALGDDLKGLAVYGRALRKILVLVEKVDQAILDKVKDVVIKARQDNMFLLLATKDDILTSSDVFPVRYLEMKTTHKHLEGEDFLSELKIEEKHMKLRVEQELKSAMFRLRQCYITATINARRATAELGDILRNSITAFELLKERCDKAKELDNSSLLIDKPPEEAELKSSISTILNAVTQASAVADEWNQS